MMKAERLPRAVVLAVAREEYRKRFPDGHKTEPPANLRPALLVLGEEAVRTAYRGRDYEVLHVSFADGMRLALARQAIESLASADAEMSDENVDAYLQAMRLVVSMAPRYLRPVSRVRRLLWRLRLRRNPFRSATDAEVGHILGFFLACRMRSRVQYPTPGERPPLLMS